MEDNTAWAYAQLKDTRQHNFLTGAAGTGKSTLIKKFIKEHEDETLVCASTGIAAVNIGGVTIHRLFSFPIIPIGFNQIKKLDPQNRPEDYKTWKIFDAIKYIIIDEISMNPCYVMDQISWFLHKNFGTNGAFGGKKIIMVGDIDQLPPVIATETAQEMLIKRRYKSPYFFDAACWNPERYAKFKTIRLTKVWRQSDPVFVNFLNDIKTNNISPFDVDRMNAKCVNPIADNGGVLLCSTNKIASETNERKLAMVQGQLTTLIGEVSGTFPENSMPVANIINLKPGCRIMTTINDQEKPSRFVNGSLGTFVERITDENGDRLIVKFDNKIEECAVPRYVFENIDYVYDEDTETVKSKSIGKFTQFPVRLAYALTIHRSQGQTFDKIIIDLGPRGAFAHGQTYVALSRCTSMEGIILRRPLNMSDFIYDKKVIEFNNRMEQLT